MVRNRVMIEANFITPIMCEKLTGMRRQSIMNMIRSGEIKPKYVDGTNWICRSDVEIIRQKKLSYKYKRKPQ